MTPVLRPHQGKISIEMGCLLIILTIVFLAPVLGVLVERWYIFVFSHL